MRAVVAAVYCRRSLEDPDGRNLSLEDQEARGRAYAASRGWPVHRAYVDDGASGRTLERPALRDLLADVKAGAVQAVVVVRLDRLSRDLLGTLQVVRTLERRKAVLVSVEEAFDTGTSMGRMFLGLLAVFAQAERERIADRTREAVKARVARGIPWGQTPYGFRREGQGREARLVPVPDQMKVVRRIHALRRRGWSLRKIARRLNTSGHRTLMGREWRSEQVRHVVQGGIYTKSLGGDQG